MRRAAAGARARFLLPKRILSLAHLQQRSAGAGDISNDRQLDGLLVLMVFKALRLFRATRESTPLYWLTYHLAIWPQPLRHEWPAIHEAGVRCVVDVRSQTQD